MTIQRPSNDPTVSDLPESGIATDDTEQQPTGPMNRFDQMTLREAWEPLPDPRETTDLDADDESDADDDWDEDGWDEEDESEGEQAEPYRDGKVHVMTEKCSTCVFRPGNLMHLGPGRLKGMADQVQATGIPFSCHQSLPYSEEAYRQHYNGAALCAGAVENYGDSSAILQMAEAMGLIEEVAPYPNPTSPSAGDNTPSASEVG